MLATQSIRNKDSDSKDYGVWAEPGNETSGKKIDLEERF